MSNEEIAAALGQVKVNDQSPPGNENGTTLSRSKEGNGKEEKQELEDDLKGSPLYEKPEMTSTGSNGEEVQAETTSDPVQNEEVEKPSENKEKTNEREYGTAPASPSQAGHYAGYAGQGYMPMYGHAVYPPPYGYPHYPQPPYYPGGYHPQYSMPPPHMMPPQQYPQGSEQTTGSPGRGYHMPSYHPYPPGSPLLSPTPGGRPHYPTHGPGHENSPSKGGEQKECPEGDVSPDDIGAAASRIKVYVKQSGHVSEELMARRSRKNAQSRSRAAKHREFVAVIDSNEPSERTPEQQKTLETYEMRRKRKNDRSRERALGKKEEIDRILGKHENRRTKIEKQFLEAALFAKARKNEGDRLRRHRLKELGFSSKGISKPGIPARGPLPSKYTHQVEQPHHMGAYGMPPPHVYAPMIPPPPHEHSGEAPLSPGGTMY